MESDDQPIVPPPATLTMFDPAPRPILYKADGTALVRRPAGFDLSQHKKENHER